MRKLCLFLGLLFAAVSAFAGPQPGPTARYLPNVEFLGWSGGDWTNGYPYYLTYRTGVVTAVMCDDYAHSGQHGDMYDAIITNLGTSNLSNVRFNQLPDALTLYREAGWLLLETLANPQSDWKDINYAVWHIFDTNSPLDQDQQTWLDKAIAEANGGFLGVNFNQVSIITPVNQYGGDNTMQEFMFLNDSTPPPGGSMPGGTTPEPSTYLMLGTGALGLWKTRKYFL